MGHGGIIKIKIGLEEEIFYYSWSFPVAEESTIFILCKKKNQQQISSRCEAPWGWEQEQNSQGQRRTGDTRQR